MEAVHGNVADIKKIRSRAVVSIHIEIPVESYAAAVAMLDEKDVLITLAPKDVGAYGLIVSEDEPDIGIAISEEKNPQLYAMGESTTEYGGPDPSPFERVPKKDHSQSRLAAMYCKNENFRRWLAVSRLNCDPIQVTEEIARQEMIRVCGIESRAELDTRPLAETKFKINFCKPYTAYIQSREGK